MSTHGLIGFICGCTFSPWHSTLVVTYFIPACVLVGRSPGFLTLSVADTLEPKLWWLRDKLDMTLQGAAKLVAIYPTLFDLSIEDSLEPKLW